MNNRANKGISLVALAITIVVIIILATLTFIANTGSVETAELSKFSQEISDYSANLKMIAIEKKNKLEIAGNSKSDKQIYYLLATGIETNNSNEIERAGYTASLNIKPEKLDGEEYYEIKDKSIVEGFNENSSFAKLAEKLYVTDKGEVFTLPGFEYTDNNETMYYVNESKYYVGTNPEIEKITFYIEGDKFEATPGSTWEEFVNEYDAIDDSLFGWRTDNAGRSYLYYENRDGKGIADEKGAVNKNDYIIENYNYSSFVPHTAECVKGNTEIYVDFNSNTKLAKDIVEGDSILYYDFENDCLGVGTVTKAYVHKNATNFVKYTFDDGSYLEVTDYHPIYTNNGWKSLTRRNGYEVPQVGDKVKTTTGWKTLQNIETYNGLEDYYDFAIANSNGQAIDNYFGNGTLVQNSIK